MNFSEVGNTIVMENNFFNSLLDRIVEKATQCAIETYRTEQMKNDEVTTKEASEILSVSKATVIRYIHDGKRRGASRVKLKARKTGKDYRINRYDLEQFKDRLTLPRD